MNQKDLYQKEIFFNRLKKKYHELKKWARKNRISAFRIYDKDIPEIPLALDVYEFLPEQITTPVEAAFYLSNISSRISQNDITAEKELSSRRHAVLYLYERPYQKLESEENEWLNLMKDSAAKILGISTERIITKQRKKQKGQNQYEKSREEKSFTGIIAEQGQLFKVCLGTYLDTGLFFDHRPLRNFIRENCSNKSVLNLFCYTGSFSVYAASGNASFVESVDMSNTYISWAKTNFELNGLNDSKRYKFTKTDAVRFLQEKSLLPKEKIQLYDIIILDPPTFSNSKSTKNMLDINRDYKNLVEMCVNLLCENGILYFSTNSTRLIFEQNELNQKIAKIIQIEDMTQKSIPKDFEGKKIHKLWKITKKS